MAQNHEKEEEYELVPLGPMRKLEQRLESIEKGGGNPELAQNLAHIIRSNQQLIDELSRSNAEMLRRIGELTAKVDTLSGSNARPQGAHEERLKKLESRLNSMILAQAVQQRAQQRWRRY